MAYISKINIGGEIRSIRDDEVRSDTDEIKKELKDKVDKVEGKQLSTEDYTMAEKLKLTGIADGANKTANNKAATKTIGLEDAGYTADDVDILIPAGTVNCKTYFDQALYYTPSTGGKIMFLNGTYNFGSPWVIERTNITLEGMGASTILNMNGTRNGTLTTAAVKSNNAAIYLGGSYNAIKNLQITTPNTTGFSLGIYLNNTANSIISGNIICNNNNGTGNSYGIYHNNTSNNIISGNIILTNSGSSNSFGIYLIGSSNNIISGNHICNNNSGNYSHGMYIGNSSNNNIITDNLFKNAHTAQTTSNTFALYIGAAGNYNQITNNNLTGVTRAASPGSAYTTSGTSATDIPGSATTIAALGTDGVIGFNVA